MINDAEGQTERLYTLKRVGSEELRDGDIKDVDMMQKARSVDVAWLIQLSHDVFVW